jgi:hypothetical protein
MVSPTLYYIHHLLYSPIAELRPQNPLEVLGQIIYLLNLVQLALMIKLEILE